MRARVPLFGLTLGSLALAEAALPTPAGLLIRGGLVVDGSGGPARRADVRVAGDLVVAVAPRLRPAPGDRILSARGRVVAPGFVDLHNHSDHQLFDRPAAETQVGQGITTALVGLDGEGPYPVGRFLARLDGSPAGLNVAALVGHGELRSRVLGRDHRRPATAREVADMVRLVETAMDEGAFGLSSGVEYEPGFFAATAELVALAEAAGIRGGFLASHVRDEAESALEALAEAVEIARRARTPVHISHLKLGAPRVWGRAAEALAILHGAGEVEVTADCYPYPFWEASTRLLVPPGRSPDTQQPWRRRLAGVGGAERVLITSFRGDPSYQGYTLQEVAERRGEDPVEVLQDIARRGHARVLGRSLEESDVAAFLRDPVVAVASDGGIRVPHPRGAGTFPRVLGRYVRERGLLDLPTAVHKMTGLPARRLGLDDRGLLRPGWKADLVVFDPAAVLDRSRPLDPQAAPSGIEHVLVNGVAVVAGGTSTGARPGRALRRPGAPGA